MVAGGRVLSPVASLQLDFCGASSSAFIPFSNTPSTSLQAQFGEEISLRHGNLPSPCARSLGALLQLSKRFLQTSCRMLEIRGEKTVSPLTFNPCFQLNSSACYILFPGTSSDIHYKMSMSKQKHQLCSWRMIPDQSRMHRGTRSPFLNSASLGGELLLAFVGWTLRFQNITMLAKATTEASL